jgi:hypothetical protein
MDDQDHTPLDFEAIALMLKQSQKYGLPVEVVHAFGQHRSEGKTTQEAAAMALYDWDI